MENEAQNFFNPFKTLPFQAIFYEINVYFEKYQMYLIFFNFVLVL